MVCENRVCLVVCVSLDTKLRTQNCVWHTRFARGLWWTHTVCTGSNTRLFWTQGGIKEETCWHRSSHTFVQDTGRPAVVNMQGFDVNWYITSWRAVDPLATFVRESYTRWTKTVRFSVNEHPMSRAIGWVFSKSGFLRVKMVFFEWTSQSVLHTLGGGIYLEKTIFISKIRGFYTGIFIHFHSTRTVLNCSF